MSCFKNLITKIYEIMQQRPGLLAVFAFCSGVQVMFLIALMTSVICTLPNLDTTSSAALN